MDHSITDTIAYTIRKATLAPLLAAVMLIFLYAVQPGIFDSAADLFRRASNWPLCLFPALLFVFTAKGTALQHNSRWLNALVWDKFLNHQWSPEQIAGRLKLENYPYQISYRTIYRAIYSGMFDVSRKREPDGVHTARRKLRHKGKPRRGKDYVEKRGQLTIPHTILERPEAAETRSRLGDWEADTVLGGKKGPCLLTLVDRRSRLLICRKLSRRSSKELAETAIQALQDHPLETITPDRGSEFRCHERVTEGLGGVQFYFSLPHHPWQRGTNENTNGLLREYFPKGQDLTDVTQEAVQCVEDELNHRPRKILGYKTPAEIHFSILLHLT